MRTTNKIWSDLRPRLFSFFLLFSTFDTNHAGFRTAFIFTIVLQTLLLFPCIVIDFTNKSFNLYFSSFRFLWIKILRKHFCQNDWWFSGLEKRSSSLAQIVDTYLFIYCFRGSWRHLRFYYFIKEIFVLGNLSRYSKYTFCLKQ